MARNLLNYQDCVRESKQNDIPAIVIVAERNEQMKDITDLQDDLFPKVQIFPNEQMLKFKKYKINLIINQERYYDTELPMK
jgi:hypothetical protein